VRTVVKVRRDDRPLLQLFARIFQLGKVTDQNAVPPSAPTASWRVLAAGDMASAVRVLDRAGLRGRKARQFAAWRVAALEVAHAKRDGRTVNVDVLRRARTALGRASRYLPEPFATEAAPTREEVCAVYIELLQEWALATDSNLTCTAYQCERLSDWPHRDTIARAFGSWAAALAAASLSPYSASPRGLAAPR
jgi:hypothetical protein